ncbi:hypothetical protein PR048_001775 [Dryococelus australis]|uniref:Uncharacterized protein n=1 Tax=Dryococelus australis TaxID=614101 RepID=A0ABQ9IIE8_9NEOP|nr:hypothetical protein PR048_001775 [Dryococelus australis]
MNQKGGGLTTNRIVASMKLRETLLLENKIILAAIYVEQCIRFYLTKGKGALFEVAVKMKGFEQEKECTEEDDIGLAMYTATTLEDDDFYGYFDRQDPTEKDSSKPAEHKQSPFWIKFSLALKDLEKFDHSAKIPV